MPLRRQDRALAAFGFALLCGSFALVPFSQAQQPKLTVTLAPQGSAAKDRPLPAGGAASLKITIRNETRNAAGPVTLRAVFPNPKVEGQPELALEGDALAGEIAKIEPGDSVERVLRVRIARAPFPAGKSEITVEARSGEQVSGAAKASLLIADCVGTFREKLAVLRAGVLNEVRDAAEAMRRPDSSLPAGRIFPMTNARKGEVMTAERLSLPLAGRQAADAQMSIEWMRFLISRWLSEVTNYSNQPANPGMCANNYYQIAGYREGLQPITKRLDGFRDSAQHTLAAARMAAGEASAANPHAIVLKIADTAGIEGTDPNARVFALLANIRGALARGTKLEPQQMEALSLAETTAWLDETNKRGQALKDAIEKVLGTIAGAHKEACVCAF
jgi:hypothetical protein